MIGWFIRWLFNCPNSEEVFLLIIDKENRLCDEDLAQVIHYLVMRKEQREMEGIY